MLGLKVQAAKCDVFLDSLDPKFKAVLFYGPDPGLVTERAQKLTFNILGNSHDPFRLTSLTSDAIKANETLLIDEVATFSMMGGRRVVRISAASDGLTKVLKSFIKNSQSDALVIIESGNLGPRSTLRRLFEAESLVAAIPCYMDDHAALSTLISKSLTPWELTIDKEAKQWLAQRLGANRANTRQEVAKLITYKLGQDSMTICLDDVVFCIADSSSLDLEDLIYNMADGNQARLLRTYSRLVAAGTSSISIVNAASRHLMRLYEVKGKLNTMSIEAAISQLKPQVFFKRRTQFESHIANWGVNSLSRGLEVLLEAEAQAKTNYSLSTVVVEHALIRVTNAGKRHKTL